MNSLCYQLLLPYISSDAVLPGLTIPTATTRHLAFTRVMPHHNGLPLAIFNVQPPPPMACHATDGPPTNGPAGLSTANFAAINGPAGPSMAAMDGPAGLTMAP